MTDHWTRRLLSRECQRDLMFATGRKQTLCQPLSDPFPDFRARHQRRSV